MHDRVDAAVPRKHVIAKVDDVIDVEQVDDRRLSRYGSRSLAREILATVHHDDEMVGAERLRDSAAAHARAEDDCDGAAHAAIPVMPRAESIAGASALRNDS